MLHAAITHANAYLPLHGEARRIQAEAVVRHRARFADTPIFDQLNCFDFWIAQLDHLNMSGLVFKARALEIRIKMPTNENKVRAQLVEYFMQRIEDMSRGNY